MKNKLETNKYRKVLLAAQRAKQLQNGARQRVHIFGAKATRVAITEVEQGVIGFHYDTDKRIKP
jgi:DNA-directed RNA polymerase subunit K/omega